MAGSSTLTGGSHVPSGCTVLSAHSCLGRALHQGGPGASGGRKRVSFFYGASSGSPRAPVSLPYAPICCSRWPEVPKPGGYIISTWATWTEWEEGSPDPQGRSGCCCQKGTGCLLSCQCGTHGRVFQGARAASGRCVCGFLSRTAVPVTPAPAPVKPPGPALCSRGSTAERSPYPGLQDTYYWRTGPTFRIRLPSCLGHVCGSRPPRLLPRNIRHPTHTALHLPGTPALHSSPWKTLQSSAQPTFKASPSRPGRPVPGLGRTRDPSAPEHATRSALCTSCL